MTQWATLAVQTVVETPMFLRRADKLLSEQELAGLIAFLASDPKAGDEIVGTGALLPTNPFTEALVCTCERRTELSVFLDDPNVPSTPITSSARSGPFRWAGKTWLFCWTEIGAKYAGGVHGFADQQAAREWALAARERLYVKAREQSPKRWARYPRKTGRRSIK